MTRYLIAGVLAGAIAGCGQTTTVTVQKPPNLGPPRGEARSIGASGCGVERWAVKTLTDPGANQVNLTPRQTTIAALAAIAPPVNPTDRVAPTETTTFTLKGTMTFVKQEADSDLHIVVADSAGRTMIVESTAPSCARGSLVLKQMEQVRLALIAHVPGLAYNSTRAIRVSLPVTVTGVGFWDRLHHQTGVAKTGVELHPLTGISFP